MIRIKSYFSFFLFVFIYTNLFAQDSSHVNYKLGISPIIIHISDGYNRSNGLQINPIISAQIDRVTLSTGPLFSINNAIKYNNFGSCGFITAINLRLNKNEKKLTYGIEYVLSWQRFVNKNTTHFNKENYSITNTFGYFLNYKLNKQYSLTQGIGIGTGYGTTNYIEEKNYDYKGTTLYFKLGIEYKL